MSINIFDTALSVESNLQAGKIPDANNYLTSLGLKPCESLNVKQCNA